MIKKRILVAPLDWGLGHAARCVPVINELLQNDADVIIAADKLPLVFLQKEFPSLETILFPGYDISYPSNSGNMAGAMVFQIPKILYGIRQENIRLQNIIKEKKIDAVISDQRFGLHTKLVPCAFITHQLMIKSPWGENILHKINRSFIDKYTECWIPDFEGEENLSGNLSHKFPLPENAKFIGPLSRFSSNQQPVTSNQQPVTSNQQPVTSNQQPVMAIISGPEPQRSIFEKLVLSQLKKSGMKSVLVRGLANTEEHYTEGNVEIHSHLGTDRMHEKILSSEIIIARSGYSTIMDLAALQKKAILIPTSGQTEQEYLAEYHHRKKHFFTMKQEDFDFNLAIRNVKKLNGIKSYSMFPDLQNILKTLVENS